MGTTDEATTRALLVSADKAARKAKADLLRRLRWHVLVAADTAAALATASRERVDIVVLDTGLPDVNGDEVSRRLKAVRPTMLVMQISTGAGQFAGLSDGGADVCLVEPVGDVELLAHALSLVRTRRAEEEIADSESFSRSVLESSPDCLKVIDPLGRLQYMNANGRQQMEVDAFDALVGAPWASFWPEQSRCLVEDALAAARRGEEYRFEAFCPTAKGTPKWWDVSVRPVPGRDGPCTRIVSVSRDITERRRAETALRESEARLASALRAGRLGVHEYDLQSGAVTWDDTVCAIWGVEPGRPVTFEMFEAAIHPDDAGLVREAIAQALDPEKGGRYEAEFRVISRADGHTRWVAADGDAVSEGGRPVRLVGTIQDITARKASAAALAASERLARSILEHQFHFSGLLTPDERIVEVSGSALRNSDLSREQLRGQMFIDTIWFRDLPEVRAQWQRQIAQAREAGTSSEVEAPYSKPDGTTGWAINRVSALRDAAGRLEHLLVEGIDISDRKRSEQIFAQRNRQLELLSTSSEQLLTADGDPDQTMEHVFSAAASMIDAETWYYHRTTSVPRVLELAMAQGVGGPERERFKTLRFGELLCGRVAETRQRLMIEDLQGSAAPESDILREAGATSYAGFPLAVGGRLIGTIGFVSRTRAHFRDGEIATIQTICDHVATALESARLRSELAEREERLRQVLDGTLAFIGVLATDGTLIEANRPAIEAGGLSREEVVGRKFWDCAWWSHSAVEVERLKEAISRAAQGEVVRYDALVRLAGNRLIPIDFMLSPVSDERGEVRLLVPSGFDISARKEAEAALRQSEDVARSQLEEIETIYASAHVGLCVLDRDLRFRRINARLAEINGTPAADHIGKTVRELLPALADAVEPIARRVLDTGEPVLDFELSGETKSQPGVLRHWVEQWLPLRDGSGAIVGVNIVVEEVTARRQAEAALRASEEKFRTFVTTAQEGIWAIDAEGVTTFVNPRMAEMLGRTPEAMIGTRVLDHCYEDDSDDARERIAENMTGKAHEFEFRFRRADGSELPVLAATTALFGPGGGVVGALGGFLDLSERKRAEERQRVLMRELAHRGKNLLAVIQSIAGRTLTGTRTLAQAREAFNGRLQALATTYGSLTEEAFEGAPLEEIVAAELKSFSGRVHIEGPRVMLSAKVAQTFALIVHELATNAAKYGALSALTGSLEVTWHLSTGGGDRRFVFDWIETGGPPAQPPSRRGFGTTLITTVAGAELKCVPQLSYDAEGFRYSIDAPLTAVGAAIEESPVRRRLRTTVLREFYDAWAAIKGTDDVLPALASFDRARFAATGGLTVAAIDPDGDVRFLEIGHALTERLGRLVDQADLTGDDPDSLKEAYRRCAKGTNPCYEHLRFDFGDGNVVAFERLLVPFSRGGRRITHIAGLVVFSGETRPAQPKRLPGAVPSGSGLP